MIRVVCSWVLVMLAASPFTAPFSSCSVSVLFEQTAHFQLVGQPGIMIAAARNDDDGSADALSISPVLQKIDLPDGTVPSLSPVVPALSFPAGLRVSVSASDLIVAPPGGYVRSAVLRL